MKVGNIRQRTKANAKRVFFKAQEVGKLCYRGGFRAYISPRLFHLLLLFVGLEILWGIGGVEGKSRGKSSQLAQ